MGESPAWGNVSGPAAWQLTPADRARYFLPEHWNEPDSYVAKLAGCSVTTARRARLELERAGVIPHREPDLSEDAWRPGRTWHARKRQGLSAWQRACLELEADPEGSDGLLAERAGCGRTAVSEARQQLEREGVIPVIPAERRRRREVLIREHLERLIRDTAPMPDLAAGLCASGRYDPDLWTPGTPAQRAEAIRICQRCPVMQPCRDWAVANLMTPDKSIVIGGLSSNARVTLRRQREREQLAAARPQLWGMPKINLLKTHCSRCSRPLHGANLLVTTRRDGRQSRRCRHCHRRSARESARRVRAQRRAAAAPAA